MMYLTNLLPRSSSSSSSFGRRRDGGATIIECNCTIPHVLHRILTPRHGCSLRLRLLSLSLSVWFPLVIGNIPCWCVENTRTKHTTILYCLPVLYQAKNNAREESPLQEKSLSLSPSPALLCRFFLRSGVGESGSSSSLEARSSRPRRERPLCWCSDTKRKRGRIFCNARL